MLTACSKLDEENNYTPGPDALFERLESQNTGINFTNTITTSPELDVFRYRNFYNGAGVGIADFNNDGLADIFFTSNMGPNRLFLNKGDWKFEDISTSAGIGGTKVWSTGVSIVDINADGWLDIYVCNAGDVQHGHRENELFINNKDLTFTEAAAEYGLADRGFTTHAAFFDYDKDGDLDCYILNNSYQPVSSLGYRNLRHVRDEFGGHKLLRNDNNKFVDVSEAAGIYGSIIGFGLGVTVGDVNDDGWPDMYISNDFYERDYLYINNGNGTFSEKLEESMGHISMFSMGADLADLNNDGYPEIFSTDMLPENDYRLKTLGAFETYDTYQLRLRNGYYHQFMRNMLHLNNKDGTYTEIGELAGVAATDWSWGALIADFNNDLNKEILVCNGIYKDLINQDFVEYLGSSDQMRTAIEGRQVDFEEFTNQMPSVKLSNFLFAQNGELKFTNVADEWGLAEPSFSNGAAYGDLDNDGDLDLVINNVNHESFVYRNRSREQTTNNYLAINFKGNEHNPFGVGATVKAFTKKGVLLYDHMPIRGFQSSMDYKIIMGVGQLSSIDSLVVRWPDMSAEILKDVPVNQLLTVSNANAKPVRQNQVSLKPMFTSVKTDSVKHIENAFNDFDHDRLRYHMLSTQGPAFAKADLNNDGLDDIFIGGSVGYPSALYIQLPGSKFRLVQSDTFLPDAESEDVAAVFFDADNDQDLDLYVVSGGSENSTQSVSQVDRLYLNQGLRNGVPQFEKTTDRLPLFYQSGSCVKPVDFDNDGDLDLFVGTRVLPTYYGLKCDQFLLINDGKGFFRDMTTDIAPSLKALGMVSDGAWLDYDSNGYPDLFVVGEWMPITLFLNDGKKLTKADSIPGLSFTDGWWNRIHAFDADGDGDQDFVLGNLGLNSHFKTTKEAPLSLYVSDFDKNGSIEPIFTFQNGEKEYPLALRQDIIKQLPGLKKEFVFYKDYADKSIDQVFDQSALNKALKLNFYEPHTGLLLNEGKQGFKLKHLPVQAQFAPVFGIETLDVDDDGLEDIVLGGNLFASKPEVGRYDALPALLLKNDGAGEFRPVNKIESGLRLNGEVRHISTMKVNGRTTLAFVRNNDSVVFYQLAK